MSTRKLTSTNNSGSKRRRAKTSSKPAARAQAVEGYVLYCLTYIHTAARAAKIVGSARFSLTKYRLLGWVTLTPGITVGDIVKRLQITHQGVNAPLRLLIEEGYVVAKHGEEDRRQKLLFATRKGSRLYARILDASVSKVEEAFRTVGPQAVRGFIAVHRRLVDPDDCEWAARAARFVEPGIARRSKALKKGRNIK